MRLEETKKIKEILADVSKIRAINPAIFNVALKPDQFKAVKEAMLDKKAAAEVTTEINMGQYKFTLRTS